MTAMHKLGTVNVTSGQSTITGSSTSFQNAAQPVVVGDWFTVDMKTFYEVLSVDSDTSLTLDRNYEGTTQAGINYSIARLKSATDIQSVAGQISVQFAKKQQFLNELTTWLNSSAATETLSDSIGNARQVKTPTEMEREHQALIDSIQADAGTIKAMRGVTIEAIRESNRRKYGVSGFIEFGGTPTETGNVIPINEGMHVWTGGSNLLYIGHRDNVLGRKSEVPVVHVDGFLVHLVSRSENNGITLNALRIPDAPDGLDRADGQGRFADLAEAIVAGGNNLSASVLDRDDLVTAEFALEAISTHGLVHPFGCKQWTDSTFEGVPLQNSNISSGYSVYHKDDTAAGHSAVWANLSEAQQAVFLNDARHNLFYINGELVQLKWKWRIFKGGHGRWQNIDFFGEGATSAVSHNTTNGYLRLQGDSIDASESTTNSILYAYEQGNVANGRGLGFNGLACSSSQGLFPNAFGGYCMLMPVALIESRHTKSVFHPSFSKKGTLKTRNSANNGPAFWYQSSHISNLADCYNTATPYQEPSSGDLLGADGSGHFAGVFHDVIYPQMVRDLRIDASNRHSLASSVTLADRLCGNGVASNRSQERAPRFYKPIKVTRSLAGVSRWEFSETVANPANYGAAWVYYAAIGVTCVANIDYTNKRIFPRIPSCPEPEYEPLTYNSSPYHSDTVIQDHYSGGANGDEIWIIPVDYSDTVTTQRLDLVANVERLEQFMTANNWDSMIGSWVPERLNSGESKTYKASRKCTAFQLALWTDDSGGTYSTDTTAFTTAFESSDNSRTAAFSGDRVYFLFYDAVTNFTNPANHVAPHLISEACAGNAPFTTSQYTGLIQSLLGQVPTNEAGPYTQCGYDLRGYRFTNVGEFTVANGYQPAHEPFTLAGDADSPTVKWFLFAHVPESGIVEFYAVFKQMRFDVSWGDNHNFDIIDDEAIVDDLNGNEVLVGCHKVDIGRHIYISPETVGA